MAILNSLDLLAQKIIVQVTEINTKIVAPNASGATTKIDASDHREVETAILNLVGNIIESSYNKIDGILLSEIITGTDGDILQWEDSSTSWITVPSATMTASGNNYEIQLNDTGAFGSSSNFLYDFDLNDFKVLDSTSIFKLEAAGTNNFIVTKDDLGVNNLLQIDSTGDNITIGAIDSTVKLQRGSSLLDESLTLIADNLNLENANFTVKTASSTSAQGFTVKNSSDDIKFNVPDNVRPVFAQHGLRINADSGGQPEIITTDNGATMDIIGFNGVSLFVGSDKVFSVFGQVVGYYATAHRLLRCLEGVDTNVVSGSDANGGVRDIVVRGGNGELNEKGGDIAIHPGLPDGLFLNGKVEIGSHIDILTVPTLVNSIEVQNGILYVKNLPTYADNASALVGLHPVDAVYKTATGDLKIVY
jgi:hypothetical protein